MKVLVSGTAGFIGFHVAKALLELHYEVIGVDNFNAYYDPQLKNARNDILCKYSGYTIYREDISQKEAIERIFKENNIDVVCNLAAQAGVRYSLTNPYVYSDTNINGFINILEECKKHNVTKVVYASSSSVYGGNTKLPFSETDAVDTPISLYAATKRADELIAHTYSHLFDIQTIGLRFFTVYGPWGRPDMAMWLFADAITKEKPIKVFNNGDMHRDFTYIDDIVSGVVSCITQNNLPKSIVMNLGNNISEHILKMIEIIEEQIGKKAIKEFLPMQPGDVKASYADIERAKKLIGFEPTSSIDVGIPKFIEWLKKHSEFTQN